MGKSSFTPTTIGAETFLGGSKSCVAVSKWTLNILAMLKGGVQKVSILVYIKEGLHEKCHIVLRWGRARNSSQTSDFPML